MSTIRSRSHRAALPLLIPLTLALFASSALAQGTNPLDPAQPPTVGGTTNAFVGYGKGQLELPVVSDDGRMYGVLADPSGKELFQFEAQLTGCMPALGSGESFTYGNGGLYGKVRKLGDADPLVQPRAALYELEGTWALVERTHGVFSAVAYKELASGRRFVAGKIYGEFELAAPGSLAATVPVGDAAPPTKSVKVPLGDVRDRRAGQRFGDAQTAPRKGGGKTPFDPASDKTAKDPLGDAKTAPRKGGGKTPFDPASDKTAKDPLGDAKTAPHKGGGKSPFGDAGVQPAPKPGGHFLMRYVFLR